MGVKGLTGLMDDDSCSESWVSQDVDSTVIDGQAFAISFYFEMCSSRWELGGDYAQFTKALRSYLKRLQKDAIKVFFIFDGSTPHKKMETKRRREAAKVAVVQKMLVPDIMLSEKLPEEPSGPAPIFLVHFLKRALADLQFDFVTADQEADAPIVAKAAELHAFVVSSDSDHMLMTGHKGFVRMLDFIRRERQQRSFPVLTAEAVAAEFDLAKERLPELASLASNDYILQEDLEDFHEKVLQLHRAAGAQQEARRQWTLLRAIAGWLKKRPGNVWRREASLTGISEECWDQSVRSYSHRGAHEEIAEDAVGVQLGAPAPAWLARAFRTSPAFPRQLAGVVVSSLHLNPVLVEPLRGMASMWLQSLPLREAAALATGRKHLEDMSYALEAGAGHHRREHTVVFRPREKRLDEAQGLPRLPADAWACLQGGEGPVCDDERSCLAEHFFGALGWQAQAARPDERLLPKSRWVQLAAVRYWMSSLQAHMERPPLWTEVAALLLLLFVPPKQRLSTPPDPTPELARALAGFQGCLLSAMELHAALGEPLGAMDFDHLYDGPFLHAHCGGGEDIDITQLLPTDEEQQRFDAVLQGLLQSLHGAMKPKLLGAAWGRESGWRFAVRSAALSGCAGTVNGGDGQRPQAEEGPRKAKALKKKLEQIAKLESRGGELTAEERSKVDKKAEFEKELQELEAEAAAPGLLDLWGVL